MHNHLLDLELQLHDFLVAAVNILLQPIYLCLQAAAYLIVFEISDPVKDILFSLFLKHVLLEHFVPGLQLSQLFRVLQIALLDLKVLFFQLRDESAVHLIKGADSGLVRLN